MKKSLLTLSLCTVCILLCAQDANFTLEPQKKLIKFGWDAPTPSYVLQYFDEIEKNMTPYDGMSIKFNSSTHRKEREHGNYAYAAGSAAIFSAIGNGLLLHQGNRKLKEPMRIQIFEYNFINTIMPHLKTGSTGLMTRCGMPSPATLR